MDKISKHNFNLYTILNSKKNTSISFGQNSFEDNKKTLSEDTLSIASSAASANGKATIALSKKKAKLDHAKLAEEISKRVALNMSAKEIYTELGISSALYCNIIKEFNIQTPRQKARQISRNINHQDFIADVKAGVSKEKILQKYNISPQQYMALIKQHNIQSKKMIANKLVENITKEELIEAIRTSKNKTEVYQKLGISESKKTYEKLKAKFGITEDPINLKEDWQLLSKKEIIDIVNSGKTIQKICEEYNITPNIYMYTLRNQNIVTPNIEARERRMSIDMNAVQEDINSGMDIADIRKKYNLSTAQFQLLINEGAITTPQKRSRDRMKSITLEEFQKVINSTTNINEAIQTLGISKSAFYKLENKFGIQAPWKRNKIQSDFPIKKEVLIAELKSGKNLDEICTKYNISQYMYYKMLQAYKIETPKMQSRKKLDNIKTDELKDKINSKSKHKEVYEELGITRKQYATLLKRRNIKTEHQNTLERIRNISKEQLLNSILAGETIYDICEKYHINPSTCQILLKQNSINWKTNGYKIKNQDLENMDSKSLKDTLANLLIENEQIADNKELQELIDFVYETEFNDKNKDKIVNFTKILKNIENGNIDCKTALNRNEIISIKQMKQEQDAIQENLINFINSYNNQNNTITNIIIKYIPTSYSDSNNKYAAQIIELINNTSDEKELEKTLTYYDAVWSNNKIVKAAENYATDNTGDIDFAKAGEYVNSFKIYNGELASKENISPIIEVIKNDNIPLNQAIEYIIQLNQLTENKNLEEICLTDFLKTFDIKDSYAKNIIRKFVEDFYINTDTQVIAKDSKGREELATLCAEAKQKIYNKYKYPKANEILALFDEALHEIVPPKGNAGIKFYNTGKQIFPRLKIMGYPDRVDSSQLNFIFDKYSDDGGHK